jgi:CheY-like chemotaxis protein
MLGSSIHVESELGYGSTFYFDFAISDLDLKPTFAQSPKVSLKKSHPEFTNKRILVAEDEEANFKLIKAVFKKENVELIRAKNGFEVINILEQDANIDIILMDIKMPVMDGYETIKILKDRFASIPVIAQTALAMANDRVKILESGFDDYIAKPLKKQSLLDKISNYL